MQGNLYFGYTCVCTLWPSGLEPKAKSHHVEARFGAQAAEMDAQRARETAWANGRCRFCTGLP